MRRDRKVVYRRQKLETEDGDQLALNFLDGRAESPRVILVHGLEGSSRSHYIVGLARIFHEMGWNVLAFEQRSCDGEMNRAPRLYHSGVVDDLELVVRDQTEAFPGRPIFLVGFSLGANQCLKWLGELGDAIPEEVVSAAAVCPPFDLRVAGPAMDRRLGGLYSRHFMRRLIPKALAKAQQYPELLDERAIRGCRTFEAFDTHATAALHGFRDAWDYWSKVSCGQFLPGVRRPSLLLASADDPFNPASTLPWDTVSRSPYLHARFTRHGGHVGFVYGRHPLQARYWYEQEIPLFFEQSLRGETVRQRL